MNPMTKTELQEQLKNAGMAFKSKATKAELQQLLTETQQTKKKTKANGHAKGAMVTLREMFTRSGVVTSKQIDKIAEKLNVQPATVRTALSDLQNERYAGKAGPLNIEKDQDGTYRLVQ